MFLHFYLLVPNFPLALLGVMHTNQGPFSIAYLEDILHLILSYLCLLLLHVHHIVHGHVVERDHSNLQKLKNPIVGIIETPANLFNTK